MNWVVSKPDLTPPHLQARLHAEASISLSLGRIWHLLKKLGLRLKKSHSRLIERDWRSQPQRCKQFAARIQSISPERLIFLDESGAAASMTRHYARGQGGRRALHTLNGLQ
jgi:hypothetical protein